VTLFRTIVLWTCFVVLCLIPLFAYSAGNSVKTVAHYTVTSKGFNVGDVTTTQRSSEEGGVFNVHFETRTAVKASFLWMGYHLDTLEKGTLRNGELVSYSRKGIENGNSFDIEGRHELSSFRFDVHEHGATHSIIIPRNSYDHTTMECPEARLDFSDKKPITLRVLDVEKMAVVKRDYHLVQNTVYSIGGKEFPCRIIDLLDQSKNARRWIIWDGSAVVMYRQDGKGDKNSYSVRANSVTKEM
jgi:uncharacterized protein (UPF0262 family)